MSGRTPLASTELRVAIGERVSAFLGWAVGRICGATGPEEEIRCHTTQRYITAFGEGILEVKRARRLAEGRGPLPNGLRRRTAEVEEEQ